MWRPCNSHQRISSSRCEPILAICLVLHAQCRPHRLPCQLALHRMHQLWQSLHKRREICSDRKTWRKHSLWRRMAAVSRRMATIRVRRVSWTCYKLLFTICSWPDIFRFLASAFRAALENDNSGTGEGSGGANDRKRKKKSRWATSNESEKTAIPGMPTILPSNLNAHQQEAYLGNYKRPTMISWMITNHHQIFVQSKSKKHISSSPSILNRTTWI